MSEEGKTPKRSRVRREKKRHLDEDGHPDSDWEEREVPEGGSEERTDD